MAFHNIPPNGFPDLPDMAGLATDVSNLSDNKANQITIAPFFNPEASYDPGDLVYYNGLSYRCVNAHEGEWDADDFATTTVSNELATLRSGLTNIENVVDVTNTTLSFDRHISDNVYTSEILLNQDGGGIIIINDKKSGDTVIASMRLFLDVNNKSLKVGYYDGTNWQYETIKQFA